MEIWELEERIHLPEGARTAVSSVGISDKEYKKWKNLFEKDFKLFLEKWKQEEKGELWALAFYVHMAADTYEKYVERGIDDKVFAETFYDITIWTEEYYRKHKLYGTDQIWWIGMSIQMKLFRLGRLQFEPMVLEEDLVGKSGILKAGTPVLNVHIPAGAPLEYAECLDSFRRAEDFFGKRNRSYICDSWLLSPALKDMLPETSNIIRFQKLFDVAKVHHTYLQAENRIFEGVLEDKSCYPEETSLQRAMKKYILAGKEPGIGVGFIANCYDYI